MKAINFLSFFLLLYCLAFVSCDEEKEPDCPNPTVDIANFDIEVYDNSGEKPLPATDAGIKKEALRLKINFEPKDAITDSTCMVLMDTLTSVRIVCKTKFYDDIQPNNEITSYFFLHYNSGDFDNNDEYAKAINLTDYQATSMPWGLDILLMRTPLAGLHEFEIILIFGSGREIVKEAKVNLI